ncbi:MAG: hypothetical protein EAZ51_05820 [Sphingobacteriales bacterium]|nr:MAG: hypothetical protein EAZ64_09010 [Sphingobacteriales bacterium]TAF80543.1 MAG: hypothetical protein EAZ51_05820 [Sphingobacteriales bacterium]
MKLLSYILGIYILALACKPCSDCTQQNLKITQTIILYKSHQHNTQQQESCSTLCICNCCGNQVVFNTIPCSVINDNPLYFKCIIPFYNQNIASVYLGNIWQPPKLS